MLKGILYIFVGAMVLGLVVGTIGTVLEGGVQVLLIFPAIGAIILFFYIGKKIMGG